MINDGLAGVAVPQRFHHVLPDESRHAVLCDYPQPAEVGLLVDGHLRARLLGLRSIAESFRKGMMRH